MNMIGLSWIVISSSLLLVVLAGVAVYWQVLRRREAITGLQICQSQLEQHMAASHQKDDELRELSAGLRAEKAHVEQLQRQVEFAQQEAGRLRTEYRDQSAQLVEVQSAASAARAQYGQLLQQHDELKQASTPVTSMPSDAWRLPSTWQPLGNVSKSSLTAATLTCRG